MHNYRTINSKQNSNNIKRIYRRESKQGRTCERKHGRETFHLKAILLPEYKQSVAFDRDIRPGGGVGEREEVEGEQEGEAAASSTAQAHQAG